MPLRLWSLILLICIGLSLPLSASQIFQTDNKIRIDGNLDDWEGVREIPIRVLPNGNLKEISPDIVVKARFTFDHKKFYVAITVTDDVITFPSRGWRYGDGFILTFFEPIQGNKSNRFYSFGFSREGKTPIKVMLNKDGTYFPPFSMKEVEYEVISDIASHSLIYELAIPFTHLLPFLPFIYKQWGLNLIYADRDQEQREILQLYPDPGYDTEHSNQRQGEIFEFIPHVPAKSEGQASMAATHFFDDDPKTVIYAVNSPTESSGWSWRYNLISEAKSTSKQGEFSVTKGINVLRFALEDEFYPPGVYDLSLGLIDNTGTLFFSDDLSFFVLRRAELEEMESEVAKAKLGELASQDKAFLESIPTAEIRLFWIREFMTTAPPFADIGPLRQWYSGLDFLIKNLQEGKPAKFLPGRVARLAHRSKLDGTLQPYSVFIPPNYSEEEAMPLLVTLHGSGVDEQQTIFSAAQTYNHYRYRLKVGQMIILAPQGRGLSDWYLGNSGLDVLECMEHVKRLYNIDESRIILDGFSMGGYGAWRLGLLHPDVFKAVVIRSGAVAPPANLKGDNILDLIEQGKQNRLFIVHGDKDNAVPVENARKAVEKLKEKGVKHRYIELEGVAHGGYDKWPEIFNWIKDVLRLGSDR